MPSGYNRPRKIAPHETVHIDVKKLRDEQIPDERGRTIPAYISGGQLQWTLYRKDGLPDDDVRANLALIGRSEQVDITRGITNNYSCQNCCAGNHVGGFIFPSSAEIEFGETAHFASFEVQETCYSLPYEFNIGAAWSSSNSAVGTISGGDITPVGVGQTSIGASWSTAFMFSEPCPPGGELRNFDELAVYQAASECLENGRRRGGPSSTEATAFDGANAVFLSPECGTCESFGFVFSAQSATLTVKTTVKKIQYQEPGTSNYIDAVSPLYVLKGTTVNFRALPDPATATFPPGQPVWSGTSGASGTGQTISVTFNSISSNTSDYKTLVAASSQTPVTVNIVVYELSTQVTPEDNYVPIPPQVARSLTDFGLKERVGFGFIASPAITAAQAGGLQWTVQTGTGTIPTPIRTDGLAIYTAPISAESSTLRLEVLSGPSKGGNISYDINVVAPVNGYLVKISNIERTLGDFGGSFIGEFFLEPRNVSFYNLHFSEGAATPTTSGYLAYFANYPHSASPMPAAINGCIPAIGCNKVAGTDTVTTRMHPANPPGLGGYVGDANWPIPWLFHENALTAGTQFTIANHHCASDKFGTALLSKKGAGPFSIAINDPTSTY